MERFIEINKRLDKDRVNQTLIYFNYFKRKNDWTFYIEKEMESITICFFKHQLTIEWNTMVISKGIERSTLARKIDRRTWFPILRFLK